MYATDYLATAILNAARGQSFAAPTTLYLGLFLSNPGKTGTAGTEVSYPGYLRQKVTFSAPAPMNGGLGIQNAANITFPTPTVAVGNIMFLGLFDSLVGGNMLLYGPFAETLGIGAYEAPVIIAGEAQWWQTGNMGIAYKTSVLNTMRGTSLSGFTPYLALFNGNPESGGAELSGTGYKRTALTFTAPAKQDAGQMLIENAAQVMTPMAAGPWGVLNHFAIMDAVSSGKPFFFRDRPAKEITKNFTIVISAGELKTTIT